MSVTEDNVSTLLQRVMSRVPEPVESREAPRRPHPPRETETIASHSDEEWKFQGIAGQTRVTTNFGKVPAHLVRKGDVVRTRTERFLQVVDIREIKLDLEYVERHPEAMPILIPRGALGGRLPSQDVVLSSAQLVTTDAKRMDPAMVPARDIARNRRAVDAPLGLVAYYQFVLEEADEIDCEGIWVRAKA